MIQGRRRVVEFNYLQEALPGVYLSNRIILRMNASVAAGTFGVSLRFWKIIFVDCNQEKVV